MRRVAAAGEVFATKQKQRTRLNSKTHRQKSRHRQHLLTNCSMSNDRCQFVEHQRVPFHRMKQKWSARLLSRNCLFHCFRLCHRGNQLRQTICLVGEQEDDTSRQNLTAGSVAGVVETMATMVTSFLPDFLRQQGVQQLLLHVDQISAENKIVLLIYIIHLCISFV